VKNREDQFQTREPEIARQPQGSRTSSGRSARTPETSASHLAALLDGLVPRVDGTRLREGLSRIGNQTILSIQERRAREADGFARFAGDPEASPEETGSVCRYLCAGAGYAENTIEGMPESQDAGVLPSMGGSAGQLRPVLLAPLFGPEALS